MQHGRLLGSFILLAVVCAGPALADDQTACADGIAAIKAELAKNPPEAAPAKAKKALRVAEREQKEAEFDECLEAIDDAKRAMK